MSSKDSIPQPPPEADELDPDVLTWDAGRPMTRAHGKQFGAIEFNDKSGLDHRFSSITNREGLTIAVLHCADSVSGALSETLFHTVAAGSRDERPRTVPYARLERLLVSVIASTRPLRLVDLTGYGLGREGMPISHGELILSNASHYATTRLWARALHDHPVQADGILWVSRQYNTSKSMMLFGDRVGANELTVVTPPQPANDPPLVDEIHAEATKARIRIIR